MKLGGSIFGEKFISHAIFQELRCFRSYKAQFYLHFPVRNHLSITWLLKGGHEITKMDIKRTKFWGSRLSDHIIILSDRVALAFNNYKGKLAQVAN